MAIQVRMRALFTLQLAAILVLAGCGSDDPGYSPGPDPENGSIEGTVRASGGAGVSGAVVALTGAVSRSTTTGSSGGYSFADLASGQYTVSITPPAGFTLPTGQSASRMVQVGSAAVTVDFALEGDPGDGNSTVIEIDLRNMAFNSDNVQIKVGQTVRWVNREAVFHTVTPDGHSEWSSASLSSVGQSFEHTFRTAGTFPYFCQPHRSAGMTGKVVVQ